MIPPPRWLGVHAVMSLFVGSACALLLAMFEVAVPNPPSPGVASFLAAIAFIAGAAALRLALHFLPSSGSFYARVAAAGAGVGFATITALLFTVEIGSGDVYAGRLVVAVLAGVFGGLAGGLAGLLAAPLAAYAHAKRWQDAFDRWLHALSMALVIVAMVVADAQASRGAKGGFDAFAFASLGALGLALTIVRDRRRRRWLAALPAGWSLARDVADHTALPSFVIGGDDVLVHNAASAGGPFRAGGAPTPVARLHRTRAQHVLLARMLLAGVTILGAAALVPLTFVRRAAANVHEVRRHEPHPAIIEGLTGPQREVVAASDYVCAVAESDHKLRCVGNTGHLIGAPRPQWRAIEFPAGPVAHAFAGAAGVCALLESEPGTPRCWSASPGGPGRPFGSDDPDVPRDFVQLSPQWSYTLGLTGRGEVWWWGDYRFLLPNDVDESERTGLRRIDGLSRIKRIAATNEHACALDEDGVVYCWGDDYQGCVRGDSPDARSVVPPTKVVGLPKIDGLVVGHHTSWAHGDGRWYSWGGMSERSMAFGGLTPGGGVQWVKDSEHLRDIVANTEYVCGLYDDGSVRCYPAGDPADRQDTFTMEGLPPGSALSIAGSPERLCARGTRDVRCWGPGRPPPLVQ